MKRFWRTVTVEAREYGFQVALDGRGLRSPMGAPQVVPSARLAQALAEEWRGQSEEVDPSSLILRDLADHAIDVVQRDRAETIARLLAYAKTDTLCYRAEPDEPLARRQRELWEPLLRDFEARHGVRFERISGIVYRHQPSETLAALRQQLDPLDDFVLSALLTLASLAASLVVGLAAVVTQADPEELWRVANLEEDWQVEQWGADGEAMARREHRLRAFVAAARFAALARGH